MRHLAITGMVTAFMMASMTRGVGHAGHAAGGADIRRHTLQRHHGAGAGVLGYLGVLGVTTSMMTPPLSIWARPVFTFQVPVSSISVSSCLFHTRYYD